VHELRLVCEPTRSQALAFASDKVLGPKAKPVPWPDAAGTTAKKLA
jgi:hypothetical protein